MEKKIKHIKLLTMILLSNHEPWKLLFLKSQSCRHFNLKVLRYTPSLVYKSGSCTHFVSGPDWWIASVLNFKHIMVNKGIKCWTKWSVRILQVPSIEISFLPGHLISYTWWAGPCRELSQDIRSQFLSVLRSVIRYVSSTFWGVSAT